MATVPPHSVEAVCQSFPIPDIVCYDPDDVPGDDVDADCNDVLHRSGVLGDDDVSPDASKKSVKFHDGLLDKAACLEQRSSLSNISTKSTLPSLPSITYSSYNSSEETSEAWSECDKSDDGRAESPILNPKEDSGLPSSNETSLLSAKEEWRKRREAKKAQKMLTKRPSYGDLLRKRTEQRKSDSASNNLLKPPTSGSSLKPPASGNSVKGSTSPSASAGKKLLVPTNEEMPCLIDHSEKLTTIASCGASEASSCVQCSPCAATMESLPELHDEVAKPTLPCSESESEMSADESLPLERADLHSIPQVVITDLHSIPQVVIKAPNEQVVEELERKLEELSRKYLLLQRENEVLKALAVQAEPFKGVLSCGPRVKAQQAYGRELDEEQWLQHNGGGRCPTCGHCL